MSKHPVNLALRFFLELAAIAAMAYGSWTASGGSGSLGYFPCTG